MILWGEFPTQSMALTNAHLRHLEHQLQNPCIGLAIRAWGIDVKFRCHWSRLTTIFSLSQEEGFEWGKHPLREKQHSETGVLFLRASQKQKTISKVEESQLISNKSRGCFLHFPLYSSFIGFGKAWCMFPGLVCFQLTVWAWMMEGLLCLHLLTCTIDIL